MIKLVKFNAPKSVATVPLSKSRVAHAVTSSLTGAVRMIVPNRFDSAACILSRSSFVRTDKVTCAIFL